MFFRNLTFFRFPTTVAKSLVELDARLEECRLKPVGPSELMSRGFIPPFGRDAEAMSHRVGDAIWITLGGEDRLLPGAVVNDELGKRIAAMEEKEGRKLGGRARKRLKEDLVMELLPRAFVRPVQTNATLDLQHGFIAVDASSKKAAESVVSELRHALGSFPALPLNAEVSARAVLTGWIAGEPLPAGLVLGDECELKDPIDGGAVVKCQRQELLCDEIKKHLESGKQVSKLALVLDDHVSFVLGDDLVVRKLKFLDGVVDQLEGTERDGLHAELDARYALMAGELKRLFAVLEPALKLSPAEA
ncbi:MAG TPA: recombination-associated protein RdgC [Arenimonas sp.]|uniref:recombination-associated protein RdgC n=1 Tax=Arenimonas sp. TaxID=1872635 RepID=UPI002D7FBBDA|nr:recombination-associated protein RdgC [Arenimonas sp.]HEU0153131.1 recombination-associated protein RdgC [Arenimonas sp.]